MKEFLRKSILLCAITASSCVQVNSVPAPEYLKYLNIEMKEINDSESKTAWNQLENKMVIALRSLKNGGFIYTSNGTIKTLKSEGSATFLAYVNETPPETQFTIYKKSSMPGIIWLKSVYMKGKYLTCDPKTDKLTFKKFNKNSTAQQWKIKSADGISQIYLENVENGGYLGIEGKTKPNQQGPVEAEPVDDSRMNCSTTDASRDNLFKISILG